MQISNATKERAISDFRRLLSFVRMRESIALILLDFIRIRRCEHCVAHSAVNYTLLIESTVHQPRTLARRTQFDRVRLFVTD